MNVQFNQTVLDNHNRRQSLQSKLNLDFFREKQEQPLCRLRTLGSSVDENKKEPTEAEKSMKLRKRMEDHYNTQISKLYSQRAPYYLLEDQPKKQNLDTCDHLLKKVGDTNNQVGVPSTVLDKEILRIFNKLKVTKTESKFKPQDRTVNIIKVFRQSDKGGPEQLGTSYAEEVTRSSIVYRDLFEKLPEIIEQQPPLRKNFYRDQNFLKAANDTLEAWKQKKSKALKEHNKTMTFSERPSTLNQTILERSTASSKSKVKRKTTSRFRIKNLDSIFEPLTFNAEQRTLKNKAVTQSLDAKQIFDLDQTMAPNEFNKKSCQTNCKMYKKSTTRNPLINIYAENGYLPKRYQSKDSNAPRFSFFDSQDYPKKVHTPGCNPRPDFTIKDSKVAPDYLKQQKDQKANKKFDDDDLFKLFK